MLVMDRYASDLALALSFWLGMSGERPASRKGDRPPAGLKGRGYRSTEVLRKTKNGDRPTRLMPRSQAARTRCARRLRG